MLSLLSVVISLLETNENIYSIIIENNNYSSSIETIYCNDVSSIYKVLENGIEYNLKILAIGDVVIDSRWYSNDSFNDMI